MTGTDRIKARILEEAKKVADLNLDEAKREADGLMAAAEREASERIAKARHSAEEEAANQKKRMHAVAGLEERKSALQARQDMVDQAFEKAMEKLVAMPDDEYGAIIKAYVLNSVREGNGEILFNEADKQRLGEPFIKELNQSFVLAGKKSTLTLASDTIRAKGGFILRYGDMEINSTLEIVMSLLRPKLEVEIASILFSA